METDPGCGEDAFVREPDHADLSRLCAALNERGARYVVVGGFAIIQHGYPRFTADIDLLIDTAPENERLVLDALMTLPDGAAREVEVGEVARYGVVRIGDEIMVDLMQEGCGVRYAEAVRDVVFVEVKGVRIPFASLPTLWRMKQTQREKDAPDRLFLRQRLEAAGIPLHPPPSQEPAPTPDAHLPVWMRRIVRAVDRWFEKRSR